VIAGEDEELAFVVWRRRGTHGPVTERRRDQGCSEEAKGRSTTLQYVRCLLSVKRSAKAILARTSAIKARTANFRSMTLELTRSLRVREAGERGSHLAPCKSDAGSAAAGRVRSLGLAGVCWCVT
jgi:hypothetical protein